MFQSSSLYPPKDSRLAHASWCKTTWFKLREGKCKCFKDSGIRSPTAGGGDHCSFSIPKWTKEKKRLQQGKKIQGCWVVYRSSSAGRCSRGLMAWTARHLPPETEIKHHKLKPAQWLAGELKSCTDHPQAFKLHLLLCLSDAQLIAGCTLQEISSSTTLELVATSSFSSLTQSMSCLCLSNRWWVLKKILYKS